MIHSKNQQRACDSCGLRRARWYCAADDAFLCQNCDSSVHSANSLARRHHRVRLQASSAAAKQTNPDQPGPAWHHGFKRKARTPRPSPKVKARVGPGQSLVPELETSAEEEEEEQLLYRVPIFDPVLAEFCSPPGEPSKETKLTLQLEDSSNCKQSSSCGGCFAGFLQSDAELAEFAADMESLLGRGMNDSFSIEELGLVDANEQEVKEEYENEVKEEYENETNTTGDDGKIYEEIDFTGETMEINFDCDDAQEEMMRDGGGDEGQQGKKIGLRLDYEAISEQWSVNGCSSPWMNGKRPQFGPDDCWLDFMGMWGVGEVQVPVHGETGGVHMDEGREARVSRYREKRRTRLFSKKIRYEVRKLNAEKRPRMKGRFVKRSSFTAANNGTGFSY